MSKQSIWNKYEIALIIKGYQTWLRGDAELNSICILLSNTFRDKAEFDGIETDDTYKNYIFRCEYEGSSIEEKEENKRRVLNELYEWALSL